MSQRRNAERAMALHELKELILKTCGEDHSGLYDASKRDLAQKLDDMRFTATELEELYNHARIYGNARMEEPIVAKMTSDFPTQFEVLIFV